MPKKKIVEVIGTIEVPKMVVSTSDGKKTIFEVFNPGGAFVRAYTLEDHGDKAEELANQYANKIQGSVK